MAYDLRAQTAAVRRIIRAFMRDLERGGAAERGIRVTITDDAPGSTKGLDRIFVGLGATLDAMPDALRAALPEIRLAHRAVFSTEGAAGRGGWEPLAPSTIADRRRKGYPPGPILLRSGALRRHVTGTPAVIAREPDGWSLTIAPSPLVEGIPKYRALARGNRATNLPARPMVAVGPASAARITSAISRHLRRVAAERGIT